MNWRRATAAVLVLSAALSLSACGAGNTGGTLPRAALLSLANAICTTASRAGGGAGGGAAPTRFRTTVAAKRYLDRIAPIADRETRSLQALHPAGDVRASWNAFVANQAALNSLLQSGRRAADSGSPTVLRSVRRLAPASRAVGAAATALGAKSCAAGPTFVLHPS